jgi:hypothetical protein
MPLPPSVVPRAPPWPPALAVLFAGSVRGLAVRKIRGAVTIVAAACLFAVSGGVADADIPPGVTKTRAKVTFELRARTGYEYEWKYNVLVRVRSAARGALLRGLRVVVTGAMKLPGHEMAIVPARLRVRGVGTYGGKIAFHMGGQWHVRVSVRGHNVVSSVTELDIVIK